MRKSTRVLHRIAVVVAVSACLSAAQAVAQAPASAQQTKHPLTTADVLAASTPADWRQIDPQSTIYMELPAGRVIIELAPQFAPHYVANVETLARQGYFNGLWVERVQDNYVAQWGDPDAKKSVGNAQRSVAAEFERPARGLSFMPLAEPDTYAPEVGFSDGFPTARDPKFGRAWLVHCYGMVGVGRDVNPDTGTGAELYAVIGQPPRQLDRNIAVVGRVLSGMPLFAAMPRGQGDLGFYANPAQRIPIKSVRLAADLPPDQRPRFQVLKTYSPTFHAWIHVKANRQDDFFLRPASGLDVCNALPPVRRAP